MKISLGQPGGFASHFAPDKSKYLESERNYPVIQLSKNIKEEDNSILMLIMKDLWLL